MDVKKLDYKRNIDNEQESETQENFFVRDICSPANEHGVRIRNGVCICKQH